MPRPYTDIVKARSANEIKNGSSTVAGCTFTGQFYTLDTYTKNTPNLSTIQSKYGNRFYNGLFVNIISGDINGGTA